MRDSEIRSIQERGKNAEYRVEELEKENKALRLAILDKNKDLVILGREEVLDLLSQNALYDRMRHSIIIPDIPLRTSAEGEKVFQEFIKRINKKT